jgi:penicillin-binding protein 1C
MGNLDQSPTDGITGSTGPGLVLRGLFAYLNRDQNTGKLALSAGLDFKDNCAFADGACAQVFDYRTSVSYKHPVLDVPGPFIQSPTPNLRLAYDPRLPADRQLFRFELGGVAPNEPVKWLINGDEIGQTSGGSLMWSVRRGSYTLTALVETADGEKTLGPVAFSVR